MHATLVERKFDRAAAEMLEEPTVRVSTFQWIRDGVDGRLTYPLVRFQIPYELMRRNHRAAQRQVERDFTNVQVSPPTLSVPIPA
jgi:hypothetical protein